MLHTSAALSTASKHLLRLGQGPTKQASQRIHACAGLSWAHVTTRGYHGGSEIEESWSCLGTHWLFVCGGSRMSMFKSHRSSGVDPCPPLIERTTNGADDFSSVTPSKYTTIMPKKHSRSLPRATRWSVNSTVYHYRRNTAYNDLLQASAS
jgi:hypothetical protein